MANHRSKAARHECGRARKVTDTGVARLFSFHYQSAVTEAELRRCPAASSSQPRRFHTNIVTPIFQQHDALKSLMEALFLHLLVITEATHDPVGTAMSARIESGQVSVTGDGQGPSSSRTGLASRLTLQIYNLYDRSLELLQKLLAKPVYQSFARPYAYFKLWSDGYGAATGGLDHTLAGSRRLRRRTIRLLTSICRTLADC